MHNKRILVVVLIFVVCGLFLFGNENNILRINGRDSSSISPTKPPANPDFSIVLNEQNNSNESGIAAIKEKDGKVIVDLLLIGTELDIPQTAHLNMGTCTSPGAIKFVLNSIMNGKSETKLSLSMIDLSKQLPLVLIVDKSNEEANVQAVCSKLNKK